MYREFPSRIDGATLWRTDSADHVGETRIVPDGSIDIIWLGDRLIVAGPDTHAHVSQHTVGHATAGIRFAPGFAPAILGIPAHEITNRRLNLDEVWASSVVGQMSHRLHSIVAAPPGRLSAATRQTTDADALALTLDRLVVAHFSALDLDISRARRSCGLLRLAAAGESAGRIAEQLDLSVRQLHRRSIDDFGYGVRTLQRVLRFQRALGLIAQGLPLAQIAALCGYADQPHLTREFTALAGAAPGQLAGESVSAANRSTELPSGSRSVA